MNTNFQSKFVLLSVLILSSSSLISMHRSKQAATVKNEIKKMEEKSVAAQKITQTYNRETEKRNLEMIALLTSSDFNSPDYAEKQAKVAALTVEQEEADKKVKAAMAALYQS